jgi:hypothetical protein
MNLRRNLREMRAHFLAASHREVAQSEALHLH